MKIKRKVLTLALLLISAQGLAYDYDYSPIDDGEYYYNNDNGYRNSDAYNSYDEGDAPREKHARYSHFPAAKYDGAGKAFVFDPKSLRWYAFANGNIINSGRASGGKYFCPDIHRPCKTPVGVFRVGVKGGPDCKSTKYPVGKGNAPMPWCMFFHGGFAIHGSWAVPDYNASHGCIRVPPSDARWLNLNFMTPGTKVIVKSY